MSLPAQLMLPQSNLDYWGYMDRPDLFVSIGDSTDPAERMLHVLRWFLCKDTKFKGEHAILKKAFTPVLGEFFRCKMIVPDARQPLFLPSEERAGRASTESHASFSSHAATLCPDADEACGEDLTIHCVSEQIIHSPSIAAFYYVSKARGGIIARGVDHVQAKFTGTAVKIGPGDHNHGVYVHIAKHNEEYNCTHPWASVSGWLSGHPYITVTDSTYITCPESKLKLILSYKEEPFFGSPKFQMEGKIFRYDPVADRSKPIRDLKKVPDADVVATVWGQWNGKIYARLHGREGLLLDILASESTVKIVPHLEKQAANESRKLWHLVAEAIHAKEYAQATKLKRDIEDEARKVRQVKGGVHESKFFDFKVPVLSTEKDVVADTCWETGKPYLKAGVSLEFDKVTE
ncbi:hypothetical protein BC830DRAFT_554565 [Chytriomyces sp. MP71]|nr:hypothetical protein BC830DRAFT_554565 [Chytriomyces sp. MP71]